MVKAIITDFGGVIYKTDWKKLDNFFVKRHGFSILFEKREDEELIKIYRDSDIGKEDFRKFFLRIKPDLSDIEKVIRDYKLGYFKFKKLNKGFLNFLKELKKEGIRLFGFTDTKKEHYSSNKEFGIYEDFERVFSSFEFGCVKKDPKAFDFLTDELKEYGLEPRECLFIDDNVNNIKSAKMKGYKTFHYTFFPKVKGIKKEIKKIIGL